MNLPIDKEITCSLEEARTLINWARETELQEGVRCTVILHGPPGVGKTSMIHQLAKEWSTPTEPWIVADLRLTDKDPTDLKGVPIYLEVDNMKFAGWAPPQNIPVVGSPKSAGGKNVLLFLDDFQQAVPTIQNLASNIIDGIIGDHKIDLLRCCIVAATNREEDMAMVFPMPTNVANRYEHIHIKPNLDEWVQWATQHKLHPAVIGFCKAYPSCWNQIPTEEVQSYGTPRSWHRVSAALTTITKMTTNPDMKLIKAMVSGNVGYGNATKFIKYLNLLNTQYRIDDIMDGQVKTSPESTDILYSIVIEGANILDGWVTEALERSPNILTSVKVMDCPAQDKLLVETMGKEKITKISNLYSWLANNCSDVAFYVLFHKLCSSNVKKYFTPATLTHPWCDSMVEFYIKTSKAIKNI